MIFPNAKFSIELTFSMILYQGYAKNTRTENDIDPNRDFAWDQDPLQVCVAVCCSVLQCVAVCCSVLQCVVKRSIRIVICVGPGSITGMCGGVCCSVVQRVAACCSVLQCVATRSI